MHIITLRALRDYWETHAGSEESLKKWFKTVKNSSWKSIQDVHKTYSSADPVPVKSGAVMTVFNVGGNNHRVIAKVEYSMGKVFIRMVLTHAEYDKDKWKESL